MRLCWNKGSLMVFSCFLSYEGYHKKGTLDFEQRMVKKLLELLVRKCHSFSTLMQTIRSSSLGTKISHMKIWKGCNKSPSARLIPVFKHCKLLCVGIYQEWGARETSRSLNTTPRLSPKFYYNHFRISVFRLFLKICKCFLRSTIKFLTVLLF